jgi:hypothetical protein
MTYSWLSCSFGLASIPWRILCQWELWWFHLPLACRVNLFPHLHCSLPFLFVVLILTLCFGMFFSDHACVLFGAIHLSKLFLLSRIILKLPPLFSLFSAFKELYLKWWKQKNFYFHHIQYLFENWSQDYNK